MNVKIDYNISLYTKSPFLKETEVIYNQPNDSYVQFKAISFVSNSSNYIAFINQGYLNNQYYHINTKHNLFSNKYSYFELESASLGKLNIGNIPSIMQNITNIVNKNSVYVFNGGLDANYQYNNNISNATYIASKAISYTSYYQNIFVAMMYQPRNSLNIFANTENNNDNYTFYKKYSFSSLIGYQNETVGLIFAAQKNYFLFNKSTDALNPYVENYYSLNNINLLAGTYYNNNGIYFGILGGYYKNLYFINSEYMGYSTYLSYKLQKLIPYVSFNFIHNANNFNIKNNYLVWGVKFNINQKVSMGIEYIDTIGSKNNFLHSYNPIYQKNTFNIYFNFLS